MLKTIIIVIIMFEVLVVGHEFGHYITAKIVGIKVNEFSIGMGPAILKRKKGETQYSFRAIPFGGYVAMEGDDEDSDDSQSFSKQPVSHRMLVVVAGAVMNYIMAIVILIIMSLIVGSPSTGLRDVVDGSPADLAGLQAGDKIIAVDGNSVNSWQDITDAITAKTEGETINFEINRDGKELELNNIPVLKNENGGMYVGIYAAYEKNLIYSIKYGFKGSVDLLKLMYKSLAMLISGEASVKEVVGPIGIVSIMGDATAQGFLYVLYITALISVNLAVINLLPLPALDGGRLLFLILCAITRKELDPNIEGRIHYVGFMLLIALTILITIKDVNQFILK